MTDPQAQAEALVHQWQQKVYELSETVDEHSVKSFEAANDQSMAHLIEVIATALTEAETRGWNAAVEAAIQFIESQCIPRGQLNDTLQRTASHVAAIPQYLRTLTRPTSETPHE